MRANQTCDLALAGRGASIVLALLLGPGGAAAQGYDGKAAGPPPKPPLRVPQVYEPARVAAAFDAFDRDRSGWLSFRELRSALDVDRREFVVIDSDGDGMVSRGEFDRHLQRQLENGAVIPWPTGGTASRPAEAPAGGKQPPSVGVASKPAGAPFTFGDPPSAPSKKPSAPTKTPGAGSTPAGPPPPAPSNP